MGTFGWAVPPGSPNPDPIDLCHAAPFCLRRFKKLCLCTASLVERTRLALHKQNQTKWPPCDKGLFQTKKCHFSHPFSDLVSKKLRHHYSDQPPPQVFLGEIVFLPSLVGREEIRSPLKTPAGEATHCPGNKISRFQQTIIQQIWQEKK